MARKRNITVIVFHEGKRPFRLNLVDEDENRLLSEALTLTL